MLRNPLLKNNPHDLSNIPADLSFWKTVSRADMATYLKPLWLALGAIDTKTKLPQHPNLTQLLESIVTRLQDFATEAMMDDCMQFAKKHRDAREASAFLQLNAMANYYLGRYEEAAKYLEVLGSVYYRDHQMETDFHSVRYNLLAALAFQACGNKMKEFEHFNLYVDTCNAIRRDPEEYVAVLKYLLANNALECIGHGLVCALDMMQREFPVTTEIGRAVSELSQTINIENINDKKSPEPAVPAQAVNNIFSHLKIESPRLDEQSAASVIEGLEAMRVKFLASLELRRNNQGDAFEILYQFKKDLYAAGIAIKNLSEEFMKKITLQELHTIIKATENLGMDYYPGIEHLFKKFPNIIAAKLQSCDDFFSLAQYETHKTPFGKILLDKTTGTERAKLYSMIVCKAEEISQIPGSGIDIWNKTTVMKEAVLTARAAANKNGFFYLGAALASFGQKRLPDHNFISGNETLRKFR